jgi:hypothetical protein
VLVPGGCAGRVVPARPLGAAATESVRQTAPGVAGVTRASEHPPGQGFLTRNGRPYSDDQVPPALLSLCEWWVGLSAEERSGLLEAAEWAEIHRKVDAAVLGKATRKTTSTLCPIEPPFSPTDEEGQQ